MSRFFHENPEASIEDYEHYVEDLLNQEPEEWDELDDSDLELLKHQENDK